MSLVQNGMLLAILAQGALALLLLWVLGWQRLPRVASREVAIDDIALSDAVWPDEAKQAANAFNNQFQLPTLFYVAAGLSLYLGPNVLVLVLAWLFVVSRYLHAAIHVTTNRVQHRFAVYVAGYAVLSIFWLALSVRVLSSIWA